MGVRRYNYHCWVRRYIPADRVLVELLRGLRTTEPVLTMLEKREQQTQALRRQLV
jgi:hypothetical protein